MRVGWGVWWWGGGRTWSSRSSSCCVQGTLLQASCGTHVFRAGGESGGFCASFGCKPISCWWYSSSSPSLSSPPSTVTISGFADSPCMWLAAQSTRLRQGWGAAAMSEGTRPLAKHESTCGHVGTQWAVRAVWATGSVGSGWWAVGNVGVHTCAARKPRMPSERTLGEAGRDRIPASASVQGLSVCMNGKALG